MPKKPSLTKQIADALETDSKEEQLKRINILKQSAQSVPVALTVFITQRGVQVTALADVDISVDDAKFILQKGVDFLTERALKAKLEKEAQDAMGFSGPPDGFTADIPAGETGGEDSEVPE